MGSYLGHTLTNILYDPFVILQVLYIDHRNRDNSLQLFFLKNLFCSLKRDPPNRQMNIQQPSLKTHRSKQIHVFRSHYFQQCLTRQALSN